MEKNPPFYCKKCHEFFQPERLQYIFYLLCNKCFTEFDLQKWTGRIAQLKDKSFEYFENSDEWIQSQIN